MNNKLIALMPNMRGGGAQRVMGLILTNAALTGYDVELLLIEKNESIDYKLDEKVKIKYVPGQKGNKLFRRANLIRFLRSYTRKNKDAVFLSFLTERNLDLLFAAPKKCKVIVSERNDPAHSIKNSKFWHNMRKRLYKKAYTVVFQTPDAMNYFADVKEINGVVISNPLSGNLPLYNTKSNNKIIISVARLSKQKNYPMLFDAFEIVYQKYPDYELHIWGKESRESGVTDYLKNYLNDKKYKNAVKFMGFSKEVSKYLVDAMVYVSSSDYEGMSNSMLEALAVGIPCVCTDCPIGGARMFIDSGKNGLLVPVGDSAAMADAIIRMIEDKKLRDGCYNYAEIIRAELDEKKIFSEWEKIIE